MPKMPKKSRIVRLVVEASSGVGEVKFFTSLPSSTCNSFKNTQSHIEPPLPIGFDNENTI
jgi:hypothetical protein